jgi:cellulose biosynthesis protein BcsQ
MKITIYSENQLVERAIRDNLAAHEVATVTDIAQAKEYDLLVIDSASMTLQQAGELSGKRFWLTQTAPETTPAGVTVIIYDGRPATIVDELKKQIEAMEVLRNVICFWGPVSGTGVTTVAMTHFQLLPSAYRVLYLSLTDVPGIEFAPIEYIGSLSDIMPRLINRVLTKQELVNAATAIENKHYLPGLSTIVDVPHYSVDDIKELLNIASSYYDYVVVDAGSGATLMSLAAISKAAMTYVVSTQSMIAAERFVQLKHQVFDLVPEISAERMSFILNKENTSLASKTKDAYGLPVVGSLRLADAENALSAEIQRSVLYERETGTGYRGDMLELVREVFTAANIKDEQVAEKKKGIFGKWGR